MTAPATRVDALVIGAGAGGLCAAALLAHRGYRVLLVERSDRIGGRASTRYIDGFAVNTGALCAELGTETQAVFKEVGAELVVRRPSPGIVCRVNGKDVDVSTGPLGLAVGGATQLLRLALSLFKPLRPKATESAHDWAKRFTRNETALSLLRNFIGSVFAASPEQLPAGLFLHYFTTKSAFKVFGFPPKGTMTAWNTLAEAIVRDGGEIWLEAEVKRLTFHPDGTVAGAVIERGGSEVEMSSRLTVSDIGPLATVDLCGKGNLPADYVAEVRAKSDPSAIITLYFASRKKLASFPGFACFSRTRRLCYAANFTPVCPENAPEGWHLYCGASVPHPAVGDFDEAAEIELLKADLREQFPGFDRARIVDIVVTRGHWPAQRAISGFDLPRSTPIANLWNVGDGVKEWGNAGITGCSETALIVADKIRAAYPLVSHVCR